MSIIIIVIVVIGLGILVMSDRPNQEASKVANNSNKSDLNTWPEEKKKVEDIGSNTYWGKKNELFPRAARIAVKHQSDSVELLQSQLMIEAYKVRILQSLLKSSGIVGYDGTIIPDERTLDDFFSRSESILDTFQEIERKKQLPNLAFNLLEKFQEKYSEGQIQQIKSGEFLLGITEEMFNDIIDYQYAIGNYDDRNKYSQRRETMLKTKAKVIRKPARGDFDQNMQFQFDDGLLVKIVKIEY